MRFKTLGLDAYGRFTNRALDFEEGARVTVIHGANEAGKTTALAAVTDALFGIEERSRFNFLHEYKAMRLSATLIGRDGRALSFARLKRRSAALVDPATEAPLGDDCLAPFIGAHDREAFLEIFGLDQARLRRGGRQLLEGGGDLAETLLAAAPGLDRVVALRDALKESAAQIFNPARKVGSSRFYMALEKRKQAQTALRETELRVDEVKRLREEARAAEAERAAAVQADVDAKAALEEARTLQRAAKELRALDGRLAARAALGPLPQVPAGFVAAAQAALRARDTARDNETRAAQGEERAAAARAAIRVDAAMLAEAARVEACDDERAAIERELQSLPKRRNEAETARAALARVAAHLGVAGGDPLLARLPGPPLLARAEKLIGARAGLEVRRDQLAADRGKLAERRGAAEKARAALGHVADPAPFKQRLAALDGAEQRAQTLAERGQRIQSRRRALDERAQRLGFADADALASRAVPRLAAAEPRLRAAKEAQAAQQRASEAQARLAEDFARAQARLAALNAGRPAPTEAALRETRRTRDEIWARLRPLAFAERAPQAEDRAAAQGFDRAILAADALADERQTETQRLAELSRTELQLAERAADLEAAAARVMQARADVEAARAAWTALWPAGMEAPAADDAGLAFLRDVEEILRERDDVRIDAAEVAPLIQTVKADREQIDALRADLGLPAQAAPRLADVRAAIGEIDARFQEARDHARDLAQAEEAEAEFARRAAQLAQESAALESEAADVLPPLAIRAGASAEEARAALLLWREALGLAKDLQSAEQRAQAIERDEAHFIAHVDAALQSVGAPAQEDRFAAARALRARLDAARQARSKAETADEALAAQRSAREAAARQRAEAGAALAQLLAQAGVEDGPDLPKLLELLERAAQCDADIADSRRRLAEICGSRTEAEIRATLVGLDDEALIRLAAQADAQSQETRLTRDRAIERHTTARAAFAALEQREGAAEAAQAEQDALAEIAEAMEKFAEEHVAAQLLTAAIERYRKEHQSPIVARAARAFATLTRGAWEGVGVDYDAEPPRLAALRDGRPHGVEALSEGAADQLFLALRIAAIEEHARRATPLPFLCDDLFVSFDEARTAAGLELLAELGQVTQVIVFTHHDHVAQCARTVLGRQASVIEL